MRRREHQGTFADAAAGSPLVIKVIGMRPKHRPYLAICKPGPEPREVVATITNPNALRGLANAILRSLETDHG